MTCGASVSTCVDRVAFAVTGLLVPVHLCTVVRTVCCHWSLWCFCIVVAWLLLKHCVLCNSIGYPWSSAFGRSLSWQHLHITTDVATVTVADLP